MSKMPPDPKNTKQYTLDNLPVPRAKDAIDIIKPSQEKQITITQIEPAIKEDELALKIAFRLMPSKAAFSRLKSDLWFNKEQISSVVIKVLQGPLATDESEITATLDMKGIAAGKHTVTVELYEWWDSTGEKLWYTAKEAIIDYVPKTRQERLVKVPIVRSVLGADLAVVSHVDKDIYSSIEKASKEEQLSKRDEW